MSTYSIVLEFVVDLYSKIRSLVSSTLTAYQVDVTSDETMWITFGYIALVVFLFVLTYRVIRWLFRI